MQTGRTASQRLRAGSSVPGVTDEGTWRWPVSLEQRCEGATGGPHGTFVFIRKRPPCFSMSISSNSVNNGVGRTF